MEILLDLLERNEIYNNLTAQSDDLINAIILTGVLLGFIVFTFPKFFKNHQNVIIKLSIIALLVILFNILIASLYYMFSIISVLQALPQNEEWAFAIFSIILIGLVIHFIFNALWFTIHEALIPHDLELVTNYNQQIFNKKFEQDKIFYSTLSLIHNKNLKKLQPLNTRYAKRYYRKYNKAAKKIMDRSKKNHLPKVKFFRYSLATQVIFLGLINGLLFNLIYVSFSEGPHIEIFLPCVSFMIIQIFFLYLGRFIS